MGELLDKVSLSLMVNGLDVPDNFKKNSQFFFQKYLKSDVDVKNTPLRNIKPGGFYFFHYRDDSNWMKWAPVYVIEFRKINDLIILFCVNFNFLPLEVRVNLFDKFLQADDFEKGGKPVLDYEKKLVLKIKYPIVYRELRKINFEWSMMEFNVAQINMAHKISLQMLPRFLYHQHPKVKYDPKKLIQIWKAKLATQEKRDKEMASARLDDFYDLEKDITGKYTELNEHINRLRKSYEKYGRN
jgi:hypothetical protein